MVNRPAKQPAVGLVVVTHGRAAECMLDAVAGILGPLPGTEAVTISMQEHFDQTMERVVEACARVNEGAGVIILVDLQGSSPYQACMAMSDGSRPAEVVSGVNLPMLLKFATSDRRELRPREMAELLRDVGRRSIRMGSEMTGKVTLEDRFR